MFNVIGESSDSCHPILVLPTVLSWHVTRAISISQYVTVPIFISLHVYISRGRFPFRDASLLRFPFRCMCTLIVAPSLSMLLMNVQMLSTESNPVLLVRTTFIFATLGLVKGTQPVLLVPSRPLYQLQHTVYANRGRVSTPFDPLWSQRFLPVFCLAARYFKPPNSMFTSVTLFCWYYRRSYPVRVGSQFASKRHLPQR
jgi:hypothetical protein